MGRNSMENDMACRCGAPLVQEGNKMVCSRRCGHEREIIKPVKSQTDLLKEIEQLKADVAFYKQRWLESPNSD